MKLQGSVFLSCLPFIFEQSKSTVQDLRRLCIAEARNIKRESSLCLVVLCRCSLVFTLQQLCGVGVASSETDFKCFLSRIKEGFALFSIEISSVDVGSICSSCVLKTFPFYLWRQRKKDSGDIWRRKFLEDLEQKRNEEVENFVMKADKQIKSVVICERICRVVCQGFILKWPEIFCFLWILI